MQNYLKVQFQSQPDDQFADDLRKFNSYLNIAVSDHPQKMKDQLYRLCKIITVKLEDIISNISQLHCYQEMFWMKWQSDPLLIDVPDLGCFQPLLCKNLIHDQVSEKLACYKVVKHQLKLNNIQGLRKRILEWKDSIVTSKLLNNNLIKGRAYLEEDSEGSNLMSSSHQSDRQSDISDYLIGDQRQTRFKRGAGRYNHDLPQSNTINQVKLSSDACSIGPLLPSHKGELSHRYQEENADFYDSMLSDGSYLNSQFSDVSSETGHVTTNAAEINSNPYHQPKKSKKRNKTKLKKNQQEELNQYQDIYHLEREINDDNVNTFIDQ